MMERVKLVGLALIGALVVVTGTAATEPDGGEGFDERLKAVMAAGVPGRPILEVRPGVWLFVEGMQPMGYAFLDAGVFVRGDARPIDETGGVGLEMSEPFLRDRRLEALEAHDDYLSLAPESPTGQWAAVWFDFDCRFCVSYHQEVTPKLLEAGVEVRYFAFPRSGPETPSAAKLASAWCQPNGEWKGYWQAVINGQAAEQAACAEAPVEPHLGLGRALGLTGTPMTVLSTGERVTGYRDASDLIARLGG